MAISVVGVDPSKSFYQSPLPEAERHKSQNNPRTLWQPCHHRSPSGATATGVQLLFGVDGYGVPRLDHGQDQVENTGKKVIETW